MKQFTPVSLLNVGDLAVYEGDNVSYRGKTCKVTGRHATGNVNIAFQDGKKIGDVFKLVKIERKNLQPSESVQYTYIGGISKHYGKTCKVISPRRDDKYTVDKTWGEVRVEFQSGEKIKTEGRYLICQRELNAPIQEGTLHVKASEFQPILPVDEIARKVAEQIRVPQATTKVVEKPVFVEVPVPVMVEVEAPKKSKSFGGNKMSKLFGDARFGKVSDFTDKVALSYEGKVVVQRPNGGDFVYVDESGIIHNVGDLTLDIDTLYFVPTTIKDLKAGDVIMNRNVFYHVHEVVDNEILTTNLSYGSEAILVNEKTLLGDKFWSKIVNPMTDTFGQSANGINPLMLAMLDKDGDTDDLIKIMMLTGGFGQTGADAGFNPLMLALLDKDGDTSIKDIMMLQMFAQNGASKPQDDKEQVTKEAK